MAPQVGLEPTTLRLTAECSAIELLRNMESGGDLLSRTVTSQVPSALKSLTSVFGMGTGGTSSSLPPEIVSYLGNRFSFCPLGLPYQRFHRPFIGTGWPLPSSFSSSSGALGRFTHPDNCTATRIQELSDLLCFSVTLIGLWTNHEIKPSTY